MIWLDYVMIVLPGLLLAAWAQVRILRAGAEGSRTAAWSNLTGAEAARLVLHAAGVTDVTIELASGELSTYYHPGARVLRLARDVHDGSTLTATGKAALEAGHAIQHAGRHPGLIYRSAIVPLAELGSQVCLVLVSGGLLLGMFRLVLLGMILFLLMVLLQVMNVPVELSAGALSRQLLLDEGLIVPEEESLVRRVQSAAAWAHVAASLVGPLARLRFPGVLAGRHWHSAYVERIRRPSR